MREAWIDRRKGMLILLVVLGHVVGGGGNLAAGSTSNLLLELWLVICIFHMPSFIVLAGLCWKSSPRNSFSVDTGQFVVKRVRHRRQLHKSYQKADSSGLNGSVA